MDVPRTPAERAARLRSLRDEKIRADPHAFVRANAALFHRWAVANPSAFPEAPSIWIVGDLHLENLGAVPDVAGKPAFAPNDFDEGAIASPAFDVARAALSIATRARSIGRGADAVSAIEALARGYAAAIVGEEVEPAPAIATLVREAKKITRRDFLEKLTGDDHPSKLPLGERFWPLSEAGHAAVASFLAREEVGKALGFEGGAKVLDAVFRVAGTASLGGWRAAVLVDVDAAAHGEKRRIVDIKEAQPSTAPTDPKTPTDPAERALAAARALVPHYGARKIAATVQSRRVIARELMPQERKLAADSIPRTELADVARSVGAAVATAHAGQLSAAEARAWKKSFTAREWLLETTSMLVGVHESAYLLHCGTR